MSIKIIPPSTPVSEDSVNDALENLTAATVATDDKVVIQDTSDADNLKTVTAQSIADLAAGGGGSSSLYSDTITAAVGNITVTANYVDAAGSGLGDEIMSVSGVVIGSTDDIVEITWNFQIASVNSPTLVMGIQVDSDTPILLHQVWAGAVANSAYTGAFTASELGISTAGTYGIKFLGAHNGGTSWTVYANTNTHKTRFTVKVTSA